MKTILHTYHFYTADPAQKTAYEDLKRTLKQTNGKCFNTWGGASHYLGPSSGAVELDSQHLFSNQWNTTDNSPHYPKQRVFDWAEDYVPHDTSLGIRKGHWLEITDEMRAIRKNTVACGYCGHREPKTGAPFHLGCLGSQYLKPGDLKLLRFRPISSDGIRPELTQGERAALAPLYEEAQLNLQEEQ